jgi:cation:H+ antiporter
MMIIHVVLLLLSFALLYYGADWLVGGASTIATSLRLSKVVVGIMLVAFGTSAPELFVNIVAAYRGHSGIALSNVSGSNLANLCLGYGICAFFGNLFIHRTKFHVDLVYFFLAPSFILFFLLVFPGGRIPLWGAIILCTLFVSYLLSVKNRMYEEEPIREKDYKTTFLKGLLAFVGGTFTLYFGSELTLRSVLRIGEYIGLSEAVLGLTFVAIGTSLPDIMASVIAMKRNEVSIAVGNILGSNIFNSLLVISGSLIASWSALSANGSISIDYSVVVILSLSFAIFAFFRQKVGYIEGLILLGTYLVYMVFRLSVLS